jgi:hypothetical protein
MTAQRVQLTAQTALALTQLLETLDAAHSTHRFYGRTFSLRMRIIGMREGQEDKWSGRFSGFKRWKSRCMM